MSSSQLDVEISLVNTNNRDLLRSCLASIPDACAGVDWRVTVVDNASDDGSADLVKQEFGWARLVLNSLRLGFSANHNKVLRPALSDESARYVLILNEDTVLEPGSVAALVSFCDARPGVGAAGPMIVGRDGRLQQSFIAFPGLKEHILEPFRLSEGAPSAARENGWLNGSCVLVRTRALQEIGPLDERFFIFYEDADLGLRLTQSAWQVALCREARIVHFGQETVAKPSRVSDMDRQMLRSRYLYFHKHRGRLQAEVVAAFTRLTFFLRSFKALAGSVLLGNPSKRTLALSLWDLARYSPKAVLPHERP